VVVVWDDIIDDDGWTEELGEQPAATIRSEGSLLNLNGYTLVLGRDWDQPTEEWAYTRSIPRGVIRSISKFERVSTYLGAASEPTKDQLPPTGDM